MCYIEGWHAIAEANRIFGFDAWNRETVESRCVLSRESKGSLPYGLYRQGPDHGPDLGGDHHPGRLWHRRRPGSIGRRGPRQGDQDRGDRCHQAGLRDLRQAVRASRSISAPACGTNPQLRSNDGEPCRSLGPNGRYYVPARPKTVMDPALAAAGVDAAKTEAASRPLPLPTCNWKRPVTPCRLATCNRKQHTRSFPTPNPPWHPNGGPC